jgi:hypothetical protein
LTHKLTLERKQMSFVHETIKNREVQITLAAPEIKQEIMQAMDNNLRITKERVKAWSSCAQGYRWFLEKFPQGGEFAEVYAALQLDKKYRDSRWLADKVFAELDAPVKVQQTALIYGADKSKIEKSVADGAEGTTTGDRANAATAGVGAHAATAGDWANAATTGDWANAATTGDWANAATTGEGAHAATTGDRANAATAGEGAYAATAGDWANAATAGVGANAATAGDRAHAATAGDWANAATTGDWANAATMGDRANATTTGEGAVASALGFAAAAKASAGGAIVLVHRTECGELLHIRASKVGENGIKPNVFYKLSAAGEFVEVEL